MLRSEDKIFIQNLWEILNRFICQNDAKIYQ